MQLQYEIASLDAIEPALREHYVKTKNGGYRLELTNYQTAEQMRTQMLADKSATGRATVRIHELEKQALQDELAETKRRAEPKPVVPPERSADDQRLEKEFTDKLNAHEAGLKAQVASLRSDRDSTALERVAAEIASKLAVPGSIDLLLPHVRERLTASDIGGRFEITVKNAASVEHLIEEFRSDPRFARAVNGPNAVDQALHAKRVAETLGISAAQTSVTRAEFERLSAAKRAAHARAGTRIIDA